MKEKDAWAGVAFERVCLLHIAQLKKALGISGVKTAVCSWQHQADEVYGKGAQIDLLIDRADNVVNVCEMKYSSIITDDDRPCIVLNYGIAPRYDYSKLM